MKKLENKILLLIGIIALAVSCETPSIDEEEKSVVTDVEILSPDKSKSKCTGCNN